MKTQPTSRLGSHTTNLNFRVLVAAFAAFVTLIFIPLLSSSSATSANKSARVNTPDSPSAQAPARVAFSHEVAPFSAAAMFPLVMPQAAPVEAVATFQADCTTPDTTFTLGQTVCAKITGAPVVGRVRRRIAIVNTAGLILAKANVTADPQTLSFTLPTDATSNDNGTVIDNRGTWRVNDINTENGSVKTSVKFEVTDPAQPVANLTITKNGPETVAAGSSLTYTLLVTNEGPDAAAAVEFTDAVPTNTTFVSFTQEGGFTCTNPEAGTTGTTTCSVTSLASGEFAEFTFTYNVDTGAAPDSTILNTATITSSTFESHTADNTSLAPVRVLAASGTGVSCTIDCPANVVVTANATEGGNPGAFVTYAAAAGFGDCGAVTNSPGSGSFFTVGAHTVTSTADAGPSCSFTVTVVDSPAPTISCPSDRTATAGPDGTATVTPGTPTFTATGGGTIHGIRSDSVAPVYDDDGNLLSPGNEIPLTDPYPTGITGITWTVTDADGRTASCRQRIIVNAVCTSDTQSPTITAPGAVSVSTGPDNPGCSVALDDELGEATATDDCSVTISVSGIPAGNNFPIGTTTLTYTATDQAGHTASATQTVTVVDDTLPHISAPADATYVCASEVPAASPSQAGGTDPNLPNGGPPTDNCGAPSVAVSETSSGAGSAASPRIIVRTFTATDSHGNSASAVQTITVADGIAPTFTSVPANASYQCPSQVPAASPSQATASDNCAAPTITVSDSSNGGAGSTASPLVITRTYTATDAAGNATNASQTITVIDNTPPTITAPANASYQCPSQVPAANASQATASDNCATPSVAVSQTTNGGIGSTASPLVITRTFTATDAANNSASAVQTITVIDNTPPTITCQANVIADFNSAVNGAVVTYTTPVGSDNCSATTTQTAGLPSGATFPAGTTTNTFRVTDAAGNFSQCSFTVTVAITSIIGLDFVTITGSAYADSYSSVGGYPATKGSLANVLSNGTITIGNSGKVWGNVRSTLANVTMTGAAQVTGNATAGTTVTTSGSASVGGTRTNNAPAPAMTLPSVSPCSPFSSTSGITGTYSYNASTGDLTLSGVNIATLANGNYCFHNVTLGNSSQLKVNGPVVIKLTGTLNTSGATSLNNTTQIPSNLRILSSYTGSNGIVLGNSTSIYSLIYAPKTGLNISGAAPLFGTSAAKSITLGSSGAIHYDTQLKSIWPAIWALL